MDVGKIAEDNWDVNNNRKILNPHKINKKPANFKHRLLRFKCHLIMMRNLLKLYLFIVEVYIRWLYVLKKNNNDLQIILNEVGENLIKLSKPYEIKDSNYFIPNEKCRMILI